MTLTVISPPGEEALSLAAAKAFLRVGHEGEDMLVASLVTSAQARLEAAAGIALVTRTLRKSWAGWPGTIGGRGFRLRPGPVTQIMSVKTIDAEGLETDVTSQFELSCGRLKVRAASWCPTVPVGGRSQVDYVAGYGEASDIPADLLLALKYMIASAYRRDGSDAIPAEAQAIITSRREVRI